MSLIDIGSTRSSMNESFYNTLMLANLRQAPNISVRSALRGGLYQIGKVTCTFHLVKQTFNYNFTVCKHLARPFILDLDLLHEHKIGVQWSGTGKRMLTHDKHILVGAIETISSGPKIITRIQINLPTRTLKI